MVVGCPGSVPGNVCIGDLQYTRWSWIHWHTFRDTEALVLHVTSGCQSCPLGGPVLGSKSTLEAHIGKEGIVHWEECIAQSRAISHGPGVEHFIVVAADTRQLGIGNLIETIGFGEQEGRVGVGNGRGTVTSTKSPEQVVAEVHITRLSSGQTVIGHIHGTSVEVGEDAVVVFSPCIVTDVEGSFAIAGVHSASDEGGVVDGRFGNGQSGVVVDVAIVFSPVPGVAILDGEPELTFTAPSLIIVKAVIPTVGDRSKLDRSGTTEELDAIIEVGKDFDELKGGSTADGTKGQTVDFIVGTNEGSTVTDGDVAKHPTVVGIIVPTEATPSFVDIDPFDVVGDG